MPYGYKKYLEYQQKSKETVKDYLKTVNMFFRFIDNKYGNNYEMYKVATSDVREFLKNKLDDGNSKTTVNKHLTILKNFFDYLWKIEKVPIDPIAKLKHFKHQTERPNLITYEALLKLLPDVLKNVNYTNLRKSIYILAIYGLNISDFHFKKGDVLDKGDSVEIILKNRPPIELNERRAEIFLSYYNESIFNGTDYVFVTKKMDQTFVPIEVMSVHYHLNEISEDYSLPSKLSPNVIRHSFTYYLFMEKRMTVEQVADIFGIENKSAATLVKESQRRNKSGKDLLKKQKNRFIKKAKEG